MNVVDIIIILFIFLFGITGSKRGMFKELVLCVGTVIVFILAYKLKNPLGNFFLLRFPMFDFPNLFKGVITLNILVYQLLAFVLVLVILLTIFSVIVSATGLLEKLLKITIILAIPSKIVGFIFGLIEGYIIAFVLLFFLTQPAFSFELFQESKLSNYIMQSSPVLTNVTKDTVSAVDSIYGLKDIKDPKTLNQQTLEIMLDKEIVDYETVHAMYESNRLKFDGIEDVLNKYK